MKATFSIQYYTRWGENLILVLPDSKRVAMSYGDGAVWTAQVDPCPASRLSGYHYELERDGVVVRKEWGTHNKKVKRAEDSVLISDSWLDLPRMAGTAVPVFSLRSEESFGVGEFYDLKLLVDWAQKTGQHILQLLPVNDTTRTGTWKDSYPYSAISSFALHPMYINLPAAGVKADKAYRKLQAELNALPQVDYERVNDEKRRLLKALFKKEGKAVLESRECVRFKKENSSWLLAYAEHCARRDSDEPEFHIFIQFHLDRQLSQVREYAHAHGVSLKGDLPIGVSRDSVEASTSPRFFNLDSQAGAPPDFFSEDGQNWGFPTYNWEEMAKDGYAWWRQRLGLMARYFDAFRIDHILGFFRIWEIPVPERSGLLGHFNPALPYTESEILSMCLPLQGLFVKHKGMYHPLINPFKSPEYAMLSDSQKQTFNNLYDDFFYHRHNSFWKELAMKKLPALLSCTQMLACGEDLGMIPDCVPEVMAELGILSLEIERMPKALGQAFGRTECYPENCVCTTSTHDMEPMRMWWAIENRDKRQHYYNDILGWSGCAPDDCTPEVSEAIIKRHLQSPAKLTILPVQDWLAMDADLRNPDFMAERVNNPANPEHYWRYRMHISLEDLLLADSFNDTVRALVTASGR